MIILRKKDYDLVATRFRAFWLVRADAHRPALLEMGKFAPIRIVREGSSSNPGRCVFKFEPEKVQIKKGAKPVSFHREG